MHVEIHKSQMNSVKIAVRVRPLLPQEKDRDVYNIIAMKGNSTTITNPVETTVTKTFTFDYSYWSMDPTQPQFASQDTVYEGMGRDMLNHAFDGYNTCIFAYGQTGAGKTYTMFGAPGYDNRGILSRICKEIFERIKDQQSEDLAFTVEVTNLTFCVAYA